MHHFRSNETAVQVFPIKAAVGLLLTAAFWFLNGCSHSPSDHRSDYRLIDAPIEHSPGSAQNRGVSSCRSPYRVVWGDTLSQIAARCGINMQALAQTNDLYPPYLLRVNQKLVLPGSKNRATLITRSAPLEKKQTWDWPMKGDLQHRFFKDSAGLNALEIYGPPGLPVKSVQSGKVVYAGGGIDHFGLMIMVKHASGYISTYAHNSTLLVKEGQKVEAGEVIATLGATGQTDRPKLYFEARFRGRKVDAKKLFR